MKFRRYSSFCDTLPEWGNVSKQFLKFLDNLNVLSKDQILTKLLIERGYAELIKGYFYNKRGKLIPNQEDIITTVTIRELTMCIWNKLYKDRYIPYHEIIEFRLFSKNDIIPIKEIKQEARKLVKEQKYYKTLLSRVAKEKPYKLNHHGAKQNIRNIENNEHAIQFIKENAKYTPARDLYIKWLDISINNQGYYDMISRRNGGSVVHTFWKNLCKNSYISWKPFKEQIWFNGTAFDITDINNISLINTP